MRTRLVVVVVVLLGLALGVRWYVAAQDTSLGLNFSPGDVLSAADMNAIVTRVDENTAALSGPSLTFTATLSGAQEIPAPTGGTLSGGELTLQFDAGLTQVVATLTLTGDSTNATRAHLHCHLAGLAGPIAFGFVDPGPCTFADLAAGTCTLTNTDFTGADCTATIGRPVNNIAALFFAARDGEIYVNLHTSDNPAGEIRGQLLRSTPAG